MVPAILVFVCLFVLIIVSTLLANRFIDARRNKRVAAMLQGAPEAVVVTTSLLKDLRKAGEGSPIERMFRRFDLSRRLEDLLGQAGVTWPAARLLRVIAVMGIAGLAVGIVFPVVLNAFVTALAFGGIGAALPVLFVKRKRKKRMALMEKQLPDAMDFLARSMRAGHAFSISLGMVGEDLPEPLGQEFRTLFNEQNLGASLPAAMGNMVQRVPLVDMRFFSSAVLLQRQTGGNLSEILGRLSEVVRERFRLRGHVRAVSAHGRMTAGILSALPVLTGIALVIVAPGYMQGLFNDPDGIKLLGGAVVSQLIGNLIIRKVVNVKV